jgi:hypothetical protein
VTTVRAKYTAIAAAVAIAESAIPTKAIAAITGIRLPRP